MDAQSDASLQGEIDGLYRLPLAEFVGARNALAKRLGREGAREAAQGVRALAKPNIVAWATNQLWWRHREDFEALLQAVRALRAGRSAAARARKHALIRLLERADAILHEAGHAGQVATLRRIERSLSAAAARELPELGRLTEEVEAPGFEVLGDGPLPGPTSETSKPSEEPELARARRDAALALGRQERAEDAAERASARANALREEATLARARASEAHATAERAETAATEAERAAALARDEAETATNEARRLATDTP